MCIRFSAVYLTACYVHTGTCFSNKPDCTRDDRLLPFMPLLFSLDQVRCRTLLLKWDIDAILEMGLTEDFYAGKDSSSESTESSSSTEEGEVQGGAAKDPGDPHTLSQYNPTLPQGENLSFVPPLSGARKAI